MDRQEKDVRLALARRAVAAEPERLAAFGSLRPGPATWRLDSALRGPAGRWSFVGGDPALVLRSRGRRH